MDVHNTLFAVGADFKRSFEDTMPTGNVDVAPTIAWLFGLDLAHADGRPLFEAFAADADPVRGQATLGSGTSQASVVTSDQTDPLDMTSALLMPDGQKKYRVELTTKTVRFACGLERTYFDKAEGVRQ